MRKGEKNRLHKVSALALLALTGAGMIVNAPGPAAATTGHAPSSTVWIQNGSFQTASMQTASIQGAPAQAALTQSAKPVPVPPPTAPNVHLGNGFARKPATQSRLSTLAGWSVSMTANTTFLWPTQFASLTATANQNVGPTPYYIRIVDETAGSTLASCATGTACTVAVTEPTATQHAFLAEITDGGGTDLTDSVNPVYVTWHGVLVSLTASPATVPVGGAATLTATASSDVGPSPFYTQIYDTTTGTRVAVCGSGTACTGTVSQSAAGAHTYIAYVGLLSTTAPPSSLQATSNPAYVAWSDSGFTVSLSAPGATFGTETVTATTNMDIGPTPYYTEIIDESTGVLLTLCGAGTSCSVSFAPSPVGDVLEAFVTQVGGPPPPAGAVAASNVVFTAKTVIG